MLRSTGTLFAIQEIAELILSMYERKFEANRRKKKIQRIY